MIAGATRGAGGAALGRHLGDAKKNEAVRELEGRGLVSKGIKAQVAELTGLGSHARTRAPLYHVHADPPADRPWSEAERADYWKAFEQEFGFEDRPFAAVEHSKNGRTHEHRVYLRVRQDGTAIRLDHDFSRREKVGRVFEYTRGEAFTPGAHSRAIVAALDRDGRTEIANAIRAAGLTDTERPRASLTPDERHQQDRTAIDKVDVRAAALAAWRASDTGTAFESALAGHGLRLAIGDATTQIVDGGGHTHDLRRTLAAAAKAEGGGKISASDIRIRVDALALPTVDGAKQSLRDASHPQAVATIETPSRPAETPSQEPISDPKPKENTDAAPPSEADPATTAAAVDRPEAGGAPDLVGQRDQRPDGGNEKRRVDPVRPSVLGFEGAIAGDLRRPEDREVDRRSSPAPDLAGAAAESGGKPARLGDHASGEDRREPDPAGIAAGRARIADRRTARGLAAAAGKRAARLAALSAALAPPSEKLRLALQESQSRTAKALSTEPWKDPASRSARAISCDLHDARISASKAKDATAEAARAAVHRARENLGFFDRVASALGLSTSKLLALDEAQDFLAQAEARRDDGGDLRTDLAGCDRQAEATVRRRETERADWRRRPEIAAALREQHGNRLVQEAIARGDLEISSLAAGGDLNAAREAALKREEAENILRRQQEAEIRQAAEAAEAAARRAEAPPPRSPAPARR